MICGVSWQNNYDKKDCRQVNEAGMRLIFCDETNLESRDGDFLIYGGVTIDSKKLLSLSTQIWELREKYAISRTEVLKYLPAPEKIDGDYNDFKRELIQTCIDSGCNLLTYQVLHGLAKDPDQARRNGINEICLNFNYSLEKEETCGIVFVDRFNDKGNEIDAHLRRKFAVGLEGEALPTSPFQLDRIVGLHYTIIGQSHMTSVVDIILGTYRTAFNFFARHQDNKYPLAKEIFEFLNPLFQKGKDGCIPRVAISFSPLNVRIEKYRASYARMVENLKFCGYEITQDYLETEVEG